VRGATTIRSYQMVNMTASSQMISGIGSGLSGRRKPANHLKNGKSVIRRYHVCGNHRNKGTAACKANGINADLAESHVLGHLSQLVTQPRILADLVRRLNDTRQVETVPLKAELEILRRRTDQFNARQ